MCKRIQLKRKKGWRMPPNTVSVARPGKYGNPFVVGRVCAGEFIENRAQAVTAFLDTYEYEMWSDFDLPSPQEIKQQLAGKDLACWCPEGEPCHADVLLRLANT